MQSGGARDEFDELEDHRTRAMRRMRRILTTRMTRASLADDIFTSPPERHTCERCSVRMSCPTQPPDLPASAMMRAFFSTHTCLPEADLFHQSHFPVSNHPFKLATRVGVWS